MNTIERSTARYAREGTAVAIIDRNRNRNRNRRDGAVLAANRYSRNMTVLGRHQAETPTRLPTAAVVLFLGGCLTLPMLVIKAGPLTLSDTLFIASASVSLVAGVRVKPSTLIQLAVFGVFASVLTSAWSAVSLFETISVGVRIVYVFTVWLWVSRGIITSVSLAVKALSMFVFGCVISSFAGLGQSAFGLEIPNAQYIFDRSSGLSTHVNGQGGALCVGATVAAAGMLLANGLVYRVLCGVAAAVCVMGVVLAGSVTGLIGILVGLIALVALDQFRTRSVLLLITTVLVGQYALSNIDDWLPGVASPLERFLDSTGQGSGESTLEIRLQTDNYAWNKILENPVVGAGLDQMSGVTFDGRTATHNIFLLSWFQGGILLVLVFAALTLIPLGQCLRQSDNLKRVLFGSSMISALAFGMTGPVLYERWFWLPFVLFIGLWSRADSTSEQGAAHTRALA